MKLEELGLNRYGYKEEQTYQTVGSSSMSSNNYLQYRRNNSEVEESYGESNNIQTGTVLRNVIIEYVPSINTNQLGFISSNGIGSGYFLPWSPQHLDLIIDDTPISFWPGQIGDSIGKVTLYGSVIACPLPTVKEALPLIRKIPQPTMVGERGHFGDRLYFDDLTFPEEVLLEKNGKKEIEHTMMIGLLMKAVVELTTKVDDLEKKIALIKN